MSSEDKVTFTIKLDKSDRDLMEKHTKDLGTTMSGWAREVLLQALPRKVESAGKAAMEAAFSALAESESGAPQVTPGVMPLPPQASPQLEMVPPPPAGVHVIETTHAFVGGHSCTYLLPIATANFTRDQCQGECQHPEQQGRVCHWASHVAKDCPKFRAKRVALPPLSPLR